MQQTLIRCPKCDWEPSDSCRWVCDVCNTKWDTFATRGQCPGCFKVFEFTACNQNKGGCGELSLHEDWYITQQVAKEPAKPTPFWFWKNKTEYPVTDEDKQWIEESLTLIAELMGPELLSSLETIIPGPQTIGKAFKGTREDAQRIFEMIVSVMNIDAWELSLQFYSNDPLDHAKGIAAAPASNNDDNWASKGSHYVNDGLGQKEIWLEITQLGDPENLTATLAYYLAYYKLMAEFAHGQPDEYLATLLSVAYGFGIFTGNSYFKFNQWQSNSRQGWRMRQVGHLPEQVIAYAMALLAHYRNEVIGWKGHLNKTMRGYFDQSYKYIEQNPLV